MTLEKIILHPRAVAKRVSRKRYVREEEFAVIVEDKAFVGLLGGKAIFSDDWSKAKTFNEESKFQFFQKNFKDPVKLFL